MKERSWSLYRCELSCKIGRNVLEGKSVPPDDSTRLEYAIYNLLHAVSEIGAAMNVLIDNMENK
jgi:hypothetical protein